MRKSVKLIGEIYAVTWVMACGLAVSGCSQRLSFKPRRVCHQDEAASAHVAVLSVAPWDEYVDALQPNFSMSEKDALAAVVPDTRRVEEKLLDIARGSLKLAPPQSLVSTNDSGQTVHSRESGDLSAVPSSEAPAGSASALPGAGLIPGDVGIDAMLKYSAATALYQEVQLLNRYVRDATRRYNFVPYAVRLQYTLMPKARHEPYDAYVNVSFFTNLDGSTPPVPSRTDDVSCKDPAACPDYDNRLKSPQVVPLLVTDDVEATLHSRTVDEIRQLSLAAVLMIQGFGASGEVQTLNDQLQSVLARDLNSLHTVSRLTDNTLRVRIGAYQETSSNYAMLPQTHNLTLLLLVPCGYADCSSPCAAIDCKEPRSIKFVTETDIVDTESGKTLGARSSRTADKELGEIDDRLQLGKVNPLVSKGKRTDVLRGLVPYVHMNDWPEFEREADGSGLRGVPKEALWAELARVTAGSKFASASFDLPELKPVAIFPPQSPVLIDDTKAQSSVVLQKGSGMKLSGLFARLNVPAKSLQLPADSVAAVGSNGDVRFTFPSLAALGVTATPMTLDVSYDGKPSCPDAAKSAGPLTGSYTVAYLKQATKKKATDPEVTLKSGARIIRADKDGNGSVDLEIEVKRAAKATVTVSGATVTSVAGTAALTNPGPSFDLAPGSYKLSLSNLQTGVPVSVSAKYADSGVEIGVIGATTGK